MVFLYQIPVFSVSFVTVSGLFRVEVLEAFVFLSAILFPIKALVVSAVSLITLSEVVLSPSFADCLA